MRILITGGTGYVGYPLTQHLGALGHVCVIMTRTPELARQRTWLAHTQCIAPTDPIPPIEAVINLAGDSVVGLWTRKKRRAIFDSRVVGTHALVQQLCALSPRPSVLLSASAVGIYGHRPQEILDESSSPSAVDDFRAHTCVAWEAAAVVAETCGIRTVQLRFGNILSTDGGYLGTLRTALRWLPCVIPGDPHVMMPWVSRDDAIRLITVTLEKTHLRGPLNVVSPHVVTQGEFFETVAQCLGTRVRGRLPTWLVRRVLGEFATAFLYSQHVVPNKALSAGFVFQDPTLHAYLHRILRS